MKANLLITTLIALALSSTAQAKAKPKPQTPPPPVAGSCTPNNGIWNGHCWTVPPIKKIPTSPKPSKPEKAK